MWLFAFPSLITFQSTGDPLTGKAKRPPRNHNKVTKSGALFCFLLFSA